MQDIGDGLIQRHRSPLAPRGRPCKFAEFAAGGGQVAAILDLRTRWESNAQRRTRGIGCPKQARSLLCWLLASSAVENTASCTRRHHSFIGYVDG